MTLRSGLLLALAGLCAGATSQAQTFNYCAFGDSITCGRYDDGFCPGPSVDPLDPNAGYPARLRNDLGCTGTNCQVYNYGDPGERTIEAVSRIDNVLGQQEFDVVLLMEGTNDVFHGISNQTIEDNLEIVAEKAANQGVDMVLASIIRFHPDGTNGHSKDAQIQNLKDRLSTLAGERSNWFANPWSVLCPTQTCFSVHYAEIPEPDQHGLHPDASGYDVLSNEFLATIQQHPVPSTPLAQTPEGDTAIRTLSWTAVDHATWYQTEWDGNREWVEGQGACGADSCSWTIPSLGPGDHTWRVRARNPRGRSGWSGSKSFHYFTAPPAVPTPLSPSGSYFGDPPAEFRWSDEAAPTNGATGYRLRVDFEGDTIFNQIVNPTCGGGECAYDSGLTWLPGNYSWRVRSTNPAGASAWSESKEFAYVDSAPAAPTPLQPTVDTFDTTPWFEWSREFGAEEYRIQVSDSSATMVVDTVVTSTATCGASSCGWESTNTLAVEDHSWRVRSINRLGSSAFSPSATFTVLACSPVDLTLEMETVTGPRQEAACATITAKNGYTVAGPDGDLELHAGDQIVLGAGFSVESGGHLRCRVDP